MGDAVTEGSMRMEMPREVRCSMQDVIMDGKCVDAQMLPMRRRTQENRKKETDTSTLGLSPLDPNKNTTI